MPVCGQCCKVQSCMHLWTVHCLASAYAQIHYRASSNLPTAYTLMHLTLRSLHKTQELPWQGVRIKALERCAGAARGSASAGEYIGTCTHAHSQVPAVSFCCASRNLSEQQRPRWSTRTQCWCSLWRRLGPQLWRRYLQRWRPPWLRLRLLLLSRLQASGAALADLCDCLSLARNCGMSFSTSHKKKRNADGGFRLRCTVPGHGFNKPA